MKYTSNSISGLNFSISRLIRSESDGRNLTLYINDAADNYKIPEMKIILSEFSLKSAAIPSRRILSVDDNKVRETKKHVLYKSELPEFMNLLFTEAADIISITANDGIMKLLLNFSECCEINLLYEAEIKYAELTAMWDEYGDKIKNITLKERAERLKTDIPAVFIALSHKDTPKIAKLMSAIAVGYALSPIDLVPDFIPVLGYLDDVLILPGLIYMAIRLIPEEVMQECREKSAGIWNDGKPMKWYYAIPVILLWIILMIIIISALAD